MDVDAGLEAVLSAFIRNSELSLIQYKACQNLIIMKMIIKDNIDYEKQHIFCQKTIAAIELYHKIQGIEVIELRMHFYNQGNISILTLYRDAVSLSEEEIDLYVQLAELEFSTVLLRESDEATLQNQSINDLKNRLLQKISKEKDTEINIFAYRDRGKMFVFDR